MFLHNERNPKTEDVLEPLAGRVPRMLGDDCAWLQGLQQNPELPLSTLLTMRYIHSYSTFPDHVFPKGPKNFYTE